LCLQQLAGALVEVAHVGAAAGDHDRVAAGERPVVDERRAGVECVVGDGDATVLAVGARPALHVTVGSVRGSV
jgi:hypothetical protein